MIFELINPSDAVTFVGDDVRIAGVAVMVLGRGAYGLTDESGACAVPLMLFGGHDEWMAEQGIGDLGKFIDDNREKLAAFLETCAYGRIVDRQGFDEAVNRMSPEAADDYRKWWNDRNRSSMNNIGAGAMRLAKALRSGSGELPAQMPTILVR